MPKTKAKAEGPVNTFPAFSFRTAILLTLILTILGLVISTMQGTDLIGALDHAKYFIFVVWGIFFSVIGPLVLLEAIRSDTELPHQLMKMATGLLFIVVVLLMQPGVTWPIIMSMALLILGLTTTVAWLRTHKT